MNSTRQSNPAPAPDVTNGIAPSCSPEAVAQLQAEVTSLRQRLREIEEERRREQDTIAKLQEESAAYRRAVVAFTREQVSQEEMERFPWHEAVLPFGEFLTQLERETEQCHEP